MYTIHLENLKFYSFHGLHAEERIMGGNFEVSLSVTSDFQDRINHIQDTIDYEKLYEQVQEVMKEPEDLLEVLAEKICHAIHQYCQRVSEITISIYKTNPPIISFSGRVGVTLTKKYNF